MRIIALGLLAVALGVLPAAAGERLRAGGRPVVVGPHFLANPPGAWFYPVQPPHGQASPVPAYPWGYFGARSKPVLVNQPGYYRDFRQTIYPRGF